VSDMTNGEYVDALHQAYQIAALLRSAPDFAAARECATRSLDVGPILDPSLWIEGSDRLECDRDLFDVLASAQRKARKIIDRRLIVEERR